MTYKSVSHVPGSVVSFVTPVSCLMSDASENSLSSETGKPLLRRFSVSQFAAGIVVAALIISAPFLRDWLAPEAIYVQEIGHELTGHRYLYDAELGWKNIPSWEATTYSQKLTTNSLGMRDREYTVDKPAGVFRSLLLVPVALGVT